MESFIPITHTGCTKCILYRDSVCTCVHMWYYYTCTCVALHDVCTCTGVHTRAYMYLKEGKEEFNEFGSQSLIIVADNELVQATDSIVPICSKQKNC